MMGNPIYYTELDFKDLDPAIIAELRIHVDHHEVDVGDTVVLVGEDGVRCWGPVVCIESSERPEKVAALTIKPHAAFGVVYTP